MKAAARRTQGKISDGRWYQLESGVQKIRGQEIPIGTTPSTVVAAAQAVNWNVQDALETAGFDPHDYAPPSDEGPAAKLSDEELLAEVRRRFQKTPERQQAPRINPNAPTV